MLFPTSGGYRQPWLVAASLSVVFTGPSLCLCLAFHKDTCDDI